MNENIKNFIQKVAADESLQAKMQAFTDMDEAYEYAASIQDGFTKEEFSKVMTKLSEMVSDNGELSDEDLANVAGGENTVTQAVTVGVSCSVASISCAAGALAAV